MGTRKILSAVSDTASQTLTVTAAAGGIGQRSGYTGPYAVAFTLINLDPDFGVEYKLSGGPWVYLGKKVGTQRLLGSPGSVLLRLVGDGATSVKVDASVEIAPVADDPMPVALTRGSVLGPSGNFTLPPNFKRASAGAARNYAHAFSSWGEFNAVQLVFMNHQTTPVVVDNHVVGASSTAWPSGTYNINLPESGWSAPGGAVNVPASADAASKQPGIALGPKIPIRSIARAAGELDNGRYPLLFARVLSAIGNDNLPLGDLGANFPARYDPINEGFSLLTAPRNDGGDFTSTNTAGWVTSGARETTPAITVFGAVFTYDQAFTTVMWHGDSIMAGGADGATGRTPFGFKATARIRASGKRAAYFNSAISGSPMDRINGRGKDFLALVKPDIVVLAPYTTNSPMGSQAQWDDQWYQVMDLVQTIHAAGKRVVLTTPLPFDSFTPTQNGYRLNQLRRVVESGLPYIDFESFANSVGRFAIAADTFDGTHLSQSGHEKAAALAQPVIDSMIA